MAGRIKAEDVALVKERSSIEDVVREHVTLRPAGPGSMKGLCPFHDEKSPSFNVRPAVGAWHCFGCGEGGDVISFVQKVEHLTFTEADRAAGPEARHGAALRGGRPARATARPSGGARGWSRRTGWRRSSTTTPCSTRPRRGPAATSCASAGSTARRPSGSASGSPRAAARSCRATCAPRASPTRRSPSAGCPGGGAAGSTTGSVDGWSGRSATSPATRSGFGARRLFDDDRIAAKYLNTSETPIYKKSTVLYGLDARQEVDRRRPQGRHRRGLHRRDGVPPRRASRVPWRPVARRSASTTSRCCGGSCATRPTWRRPGWCSPSTATRPGRRPRCGRSARTSAGRRSPSWRWPTAAWTPASCGSPRATTPCATSSTTPCRCSSSRCAPRSPGST